MDADHSSTFGVEYLKRNSGLFAPREPSLGHELPMLSLGEREESSNCTVAGEIVGRVGTSTTHLVCFWIQRTRGIKEYKHLNEFHPNGRHYLDAALTFLRDVAANFRGPGSVTVVWAMHDDASIEPEVILALMAKGVYTLAHSTLPLIQEHVFYVPNFHFISSKGFRDILSSLHSSKKFEKRKKTVFWRGVTTGSLFNGTDHPLKSCSELPRVRAARIAKSAAWLDFGITSAVQICEGHDSVIHADGISKGHSVESEWAASRGILDIDGNVDAWGQFWRLACGSVVFKVKSHYVNYFSGYFFAGKHFIEIKPDLSDLREKTSRITSVNQEDVASFKRMTSAASFTAQNLNYEKIVQRDRKSVV